MRAFPSAPEFLGVAAFVYGVLAMQPLYYKLTVLVHELIFRR